MNTLELLKHGWSKESCTIDTHEVDIYRNEKFVYSESSFGDRRHEIDGEEVSEEDFIEMASTFQLI